MGPSTRIFSDIESDQPQFTVNQRYPVYFPELRPFFLENANFFTTPSPLTLLYNPQHRASGVWRAGDRQAGHTNIGLLAIDDREPGETVGPGDSLYKKRATICRGTRLPGFRQRVEHFRAVYRLRVRPWMEPHRRSRFYRALQRQVDGRGAMGGKLDHGRRRQSRLFRRTNVERECKAAPGTPST